MSESSGLKVTLINLFLHNLNKEGIQAIKCTEQEIDGIKA